MQTMREEMRDMNDIIKNLITKTVAAIAQTAETSGAMLETLSVHAHGEDESLADMLAANAACLKTVAENLAQLKEYK